MGRRIMNLYLFGEVIYDEGNQDTYKCITLKDADKKLIHQFDIGDPCVDLANVHIFLDLAKQGVSWSSSYEHFLQDGNKWKWCRIDKETTEIFFDVSILIEKYGLDEWRNKTKEFIIPNDNSIKSIDDFWKYYISVLNPNQNGE